MKNVSRFLALLLALVMLMLPFAAFASDLSMDLQGMNKADYDKILEYVLKGQFEKASNEIFNELKDIDTADALYEALNNLGTDYDLISNAQLDQLLALLDEMRTKENYTDDEISTEESEVDFVIRNYTNVAGFKAPVTGTSGMRKLAVAKDAQQDDNGVVLNKTAEVNEDGTYTIRMEVYATGEKTTTTVTEEIPTDIILVLDQSGSMDEDYFTFTYKELEDKSNGNAYKNRDKPLYYRLESGDYVKVHIARSSAGTNDVYTEYMNQPNENTWYGNGGYYNNKDNLYEKVGDEYKKITVSRTGDFFSGYEYTYTFPDGTKVTSRGSNSRPDFGGKTVYLHQRVEQYKYTYTYTLNGNTVILSESIGDTAEPMLYADGNPTETPLKLYTKERVNSGKKLAALKAAATDFANSVAGKAAGADGQLGTNDDIDHRIAVVGYADTDRDYGYNTGVFIGSRLNRYKTDAQNVYSSAFQNMNTTAGKNDVTASLAALKASGATRIDLGLEMAKGILNANPVAAGEKRNRVVVVFTDGSPTDYNGFQLNVANKAISEARTIKGAGATVYAIGIFSGADATSAGTKPGGNLSDNSNQLPAACNWFMQNVSSNDGTPRTPSYYLTPSDEGGLDSIFKQISSQIETGGTTTTLEENTVVNDYLTPQFYLPENMTANDVTLESWRLTGVDAAGNYTWEENSDAMGATAQIVKDAAGNDGVAVTGFDFSENWCGKETTNGSVTYRGNKLVIQFDAKLKEGFLGGEGVITNADGSGVYDGDGNQVDEFEKPDVDVPTDPETIAINANIFLGGYYKESITPEAIKGKTVIEINGVQLDLTKPNYGLEEWQREYIDSVVVKITDADNNELTEIPQLENDFTYTATVTVKLKGEEGTTITRTDNGTIYVFKPEVTYRDTTASIGDPIKYVVNNHVSTRWKNSEGQYSDDDGVKMLNDAEPPTLIFTYEPENNGTVGDASHVVVKGDLPVQVSVGININGTDTTDVTEHTTFFREICTVCGHQHGQVDTSGDTWTNFVIHVLNGDLKITKKGCDEALDLNQSFVFKVKGIDNDIELDIVIHGNNSVTIKDLPAGKYTVTEDTAWSWRYTPKGNDNDKEATVAGGDTPTEVTFDNRRDKDKWLDGNTYCDNWWSTSTSIKPSKGN